jgi:hypothetical protein
MRVSSVPLVDSKEPSGIEMIHSIDYEGVDATGSRKGLRYNPPDVSGLDMPDFLSQQELEALWNNLDKNSDAWLQVSAALVIKDRRLDGRDGELDAEMEGEGDNAGGESDDDDAGGDETDN